MSSVKSKSPDETSEKPANTPAPAEPPQSSEEVEVNEFIEMVLPAVEDMLSRVIVTIPTRFVTVTQRRKFGSVEHEIGVTAAVWVTSALQQQVEIDKLTEQVNALHDHYAKDYLPNTNTGGGGQQNAGVPRKEYEADRLVLSIKDGKKYYNIVTTSGRWMKYGCPVWDEQVKQYGLAELLGAETSMKLHGVTVVCEDREKSGAVREIKGLK